MELYDAMRSTFAARDYLDEQIPDEVLFRMLDNARFAPSGGNRQGWRLLVIKDKEIRRQLKDILEPTVKQLTKLKRHPVASFTWIDTFDGEQFAKN